MSIQNNDVTITTLMIPIGAFPVVTEQTILKEALEEMDNFRLGVACVVNNKGHLIGILTDGDIRRKLLSVQKPLSAFFIDDAIKYSTPNPVVISPSNSLYEAHALMGKKQVWELPVVDNNKLVGLLHLHPVVDALLNR